MFDKTHTVRIDCPVDEVFAYVAEPRNEQRYHRELVEVIRDGNGAYRIGERFQWVIKMLGASTYGMEVTGLEPERLIQLTTVEGKGRMKPVVTMTFQPDGDGTLFARRIQFEPAGFLRIAAPLLKRIPNDPNAKTAQALKRVLETQPAE